MGGLKDSPLIKGAEGVVRRGLFFWLSPHFCRLKRVLFLRKAPTVGSQPPLSPFLKGELS